MSKMTKIGDHVRCPECGGEAHVVWVSQDGKLAAINCTRHHGHISPPIKTRGKNYYNKTETKTKKGMVFLVEVS